VDCCCSSLYSPPIYSFNIETERSSEINESQRSRWTNSACARKIFTWLTAITERESMSEDAILLALLDFYSDKASASASLVVATFFGLFAVLTSLKDSGYHPWMFWVYWSLWAAGLYFLLSFRYWTLYAVWTMNFLRRQGQISPAKSLEDQIQEKVVNEWRKTLLGWLFVWLKRVPAQPKKGDEKGEVLRLGDVLQSFFFFGFGLIISIIFFPETRFLVIFFLEPHFPEQWWEWLQFFFSIGLFIFFFSDLISVLRYHRCR